MATQYLAGRAVVFTVEGTMAYTGVAVSQNSIQSASLSDEFDLLEVRNQRGQTITQMAINIRHRITIEMIPTAVAGTNTQAAAALAVELPEPLTLVTLAGFELPEFNGNWNYLGGGSIGLSNQGTISMTLPLGRPDGTALTPVNIT